jgi:acetyltransferase
VESKQVLAAYGIPVVPTLTAADESAAVERAAQLGYPVALKLWSETITHKARVGGVRLNLVDEAAVREAYRAIEAAVAPLGPGHFQGVSVQPMIERSGPELIVGSSVDPEFGPVLLFGAGGGLVEVMEDRALGLPPLNSTLAQRLIEQTRIFAALTGARGGRAVDLEQLRQLIVRFSWLVVEQPRLREIDANPVLARGNDLVALDARIILHSWGTADSELPRPAIRPYPARYVGSWTLRDGTPVTIRPIRPEDEPLMAAFHAGLSPESVYLRFFAGIPLETRARHDSLIRACFIDYDRAMALVAERRDPSGIREIIGIGRLTKLPGWEEAEFAVVVADQYQLQGLGRALLGRLVQVGKDEKLRRIVGDILPHNDKMKAVCRRLGFRLEPSPDGGLVTAEIRL